ncbi:MAG: hypothetical protein NTV51_22795 [Verrucomicrobia bacterium]|nr:hypothetical protein [Verrucomicrobiota bacterium]
MPLVSPPLLAEVAAAAPRVGGPLFGNIWLALFAVLGGIAVFLVLVALLGRWLAATHPDDPPRPARPPAPVPVVEVGVSAEITAVIAASVATVLGSRARITSVSLVPANTPSVESLMQQWSMEGRRQIYSSHKVR